MLQFISNKTNKCSIVEEITAVLEGGCKWIQLRMKEASNDEIEAVITEIKPICKEHEAILVLDDNVELTKKMEIDGVHLGKNDMNPAEARELLGQEYIIGATANTFEDIAALSKIDIDYIGLGPFRYTDTKKNLSPILGLEGYKNILQQMQNSNIKIPIVAIGGITIEDITAIMDTGVSGIAISGAIINADNMKSETELFLNELNN